MKKIKIVLKKQNDKKEIYEENLEFDESINFLDLSNQNIIEIPKGLEQFKNLENLYLHDNQITKIENLDNNINLKRLFLYNNQITKIENIDKNINLQELYLFNNKITKIENFDNLINLKILYLQNNQINKIENLDNLINLKILYLQNNQINKIENIHHLDKLKYFRLFDEDQNENIEESKQISLSNKEIELKEIQIQKEIEYFDNNFDKIKQQFITSNISNNDLII